MGQLFSSSYEPSIFMPVEWHKNHVIYKICNIIDNVNLHEKYDVQYYNNGIKRINVTDLLDSGDFNFSLKNVLESIRNNIKHYYITRTSIENEQSYIFFKFIEEV